MVAYAMNEIAVRMRNGGKITDGEDLGVSIKTFSCLDQLLTMIFAQLVVCDSLRDIKVCLSANPKSLYHHLGIHSRIRRSTLADANEKRDARIFEDFAKILITEVLQTGD